MNLTPAQQRSFGELHNKIRGAVVAAIRDRIPLHLIVAELVTTANAVIMSGHDVPERPLVAVPDPIIKPPRRE